MELLIIKLIAIAILQMRVLAERASTQSGNRSITGNIYIPSCDHPSCLQEIPDGKLKVPQLIQKYGYPVETHEVTTGDGYILTMHRIPYGKTCLPGIQRRSVIFLQHGLLGDSSNWIINTESKALGYVLANAGYDVWMGNARGNTYSKRHVRMKPDNPEFWNFSYNEMGKYDIPAVLSYILAYTDQPDLYYVGHSMGTSMLFVALDEYPELNSKIKLMSAFAPLAYTKHMRGPLRHLAPIEDRIELLLQLFGAYEFMPNTIAMDFLGAKICREENPATELCTNTLFIATGFDSEQINRTLIPAILGHSPAGTATRALAHIAQGVNSGLFRRFDYGISANLDVYGRISPPEYNISKVTCPVAFYWGQNDWLCAPEDVKHLASQMPNLVRNYRIPYDKWNHVDFVFAKQIDVLLHKPFMDFQSAF